MNTVSKPRLQPAGWTLAFLAALAFLGTSLGYGQVKINEIMADNKNTLPHDGAYPDWVELYNPAAQAVNLSGWSLSDDPGTPNKFVFPNGTVIAAGGYLMVWCDLAVGQSGLHTGFALNDNGETVSLYNAAFQQVDSVTFGLQLSDISVGRSPNGGEVWKPSFPTPEFANRALAVGSPNTLKINEWMARPSSGDDWFELFNPATNIVDLSGLCFSDQTFSPATNRVIPPLSFIAPGGYQLFWADDNPKDANHVDFKLGNGDRIRLYASDKTTLIDSVEFGAQTENASMGRLPDGSDSIVVFTAGKATPEDSNFQFISDLIINEVLTHTDFPLEDAIELYNAGTQPIDISYWWLSNSRDDPKKFRVPAGTIIPAGGYQVFYEKPGQSGGFNPNGLGTDRSFTLNSAHGDEVYLHAAANDATGTLLGSRTYRTFESSQNGVSLGRYVNSEGKTDFVPMERMTFGTSVTTNDPPTLETVQLFRSGKGAANAYPLVGPLVISEIMYHPPDLPPLPGTTNLLDNSLDEYIEIYNMSGVEVPLYDAHGLYWLANFGYYADGRTNTWRLRGGVDFNFPPEVKLAPGGSLVVVNFDPATNPTQLQAFQAKYGLGTEAAIFGPYSGKLLNGGLTLELYKPDPPQSPEHSDAGYVPHILVDRVKYSDGAPWPEAADGGGSALERIFPEHYGNDPANWRASSPNPGRHAPGEIAFARENQSLALSFPGLAGSGYSVWYAGALGAGWQLYTNLLPRTNTATRQVAVPIGSNGSRFYRLTTP